MPSTPQTRPPQTEAATQTAPNPAANPAANQAQAAPTLKPPPLLADLYIFHWSALTLRLPLVSASAVGLCLAVGLAAHHPGGGLIAGGGALTIGFGVNQRLSDSRLLPMIAATVSMAAAALVGTVAGHRSFVLVAVAALTAFVYGLVTAQNAGLGWVGQQACISLYVASAFPTGPRPAFVRAGLILAGGAVQILFNSLALHLMPELKKDLARIPRSLLVAVRNRGTDLFSDLSSLPSNLGSIVLPTASRRASLSYALHLTATIAISTEVYRRIGIQSGYWIPMTALLVQKPAFFETLSRAGARILGTLAGAYLSTLLIAHVHLTPATLAAFATLFALLSLATNAVNYGLFSLFLTSYIVFLLSLNQIPGPDIAHRRALCTLVGGLIALVIHLDDLRHFGNRFAKNTVT